MKFTYQQMEVIRARSSEMGFFAQWCGERSEDEAWLRVSRGVAEIAMCFFPARKPILSVEASDPMELAHTAIELVAIHSTLTTGLYEVHTASPCSEVAPPTGCRGCVWELQPCDATRCFKALNPESAP